MARFLDRHGEGIHHICFEVRDFGGTIERLEKAGLRVLGAAGRAGAEGSRIAFVHPRGAAGVLIELREKASPPMKRRRDREPGQGAAPKETP